MTRWSAYNTLILLNGRYYIHNAFIRNLISNNQLGKKQFTEWNI